MTVNSNEQTKSPNVFPLKSCESLTSEHITIGCLATGYVPEPVTIEWNSGAITSASKEMTIKYKPVFATSSFLGISQSRLKNENFTCTVEHKPTSFKISKKITVTVKEKRQDPTNKPNTTNAKIYTFCPHLKEIGEAKDHSELTLVCMIKGFSSNDFKTSWKENKAIKDDYKEFTAEGKNEKISMLKIRKQDWTSRKTYTCIFGDLHDSVFIDDCMPGSAIPVSYITYDGEEEGDDHVDDDDSFWTTVATFIVLFLLSVFYSAVVTFVKVKWLLSRVLQIEDTYLKNLELDPHSHLSS